jgi:hypothetical protein
VPDADALKEEAEESPLELRTLEEMSDQKSVEVVELAVIVPDLMLVT